MATRQQVKASAERKAQRLEALQAIEGQALPLPTEPRAQPAHPDTDTPEALAREIISLAAQGLSESQIANHLAIPAEELREWGESHIVIRSALSRARTAMRAWWEEKARRAIVVGDNRFPAGAWSQVMRARFSEYDDKAAVNITLDLGSLVSIARPVPELPDRRAVQVPSALIEGETVRLPASQTPGKGPDGAA